MTTFLNYNLCASQEKKDRKRGASHIPKWVNKARLNSECVRMHELDYWINYTNRVSLEKKLDKDEWSQVKIFTLPKRILKKQVEPEHWDVFLSTVKLMKPRKDNWKYVHIAVDFYYLGEYIPQFIYLRKLYGRFDDSNLSEDFKLIRNSYHDDYDFVEYYFKNKYTIRVCKCKFIEKK